MGREDITLRELQHIMYRKENITIYDREPDDTDNGTDELRFADLKFQNLYIGKTKEIPEELLDRKVLVVWALSEKGTNGTVMIQLKEEEAP